MEVQNERTVMSRSTRLHCLALERLDVPAQFGIPWANHQVTLSFVPDGTPVEGINSNLSAYFAAGGVANSTWQAEVLRAVQEWTAVADVDVGLVSDNGAAMGAAGRSQHDLRFGDIRVSGRPLSSDVLAITTPPGPAGGTRAGDIIINTSMPICIGGSATQYDLYTFMLQEAGHALSIGNSSNIDSPMYEVYQDVRLGLITADENNLIALYGARQEDDYDATINNDAFYSATKIAVPLTLAANGQSIVELVADLSTQNDNDFYSFRVPDNAVGDIAIRLITGGMSLLEGEFVVMSTNAEEVEDFTVSIPKAGELEATVGGLLPGGTYVIQVKRANVDFAVGQYQLQIDFNPGSSTSGNGPTANWVVNDDHTDDSIATARILADTPSSAGNFGIDARFVDATDMDVYRIEVSGIEGTSRLLTVSIGAEVDGLRPLVKLRNAAGVLIPCDVVRNSDGLYSIQANVSVGQDVYLVASADPNGAAVVGDYRLDASFNIAATPLFEYIGGTLTQSVMGKAQAFTVRSGAVKHFVLTQSAATPTDDFGANVVIKNSSGTTVLRFGTTANRSVSADVFLAPGSYAMFVVGKVRTSGATLPALDFSVRGFNLSDPSGPRGGCSDTVDEDDLEGPNIVYGDHEDDWGDIDDWVPLGP